MIIIIKFILVLSLSLIHSLPHDDGKYNPKKYKVYDDGKYYRPLDEGKYIPGDEGKYTYIYRQGLYPVDDGDYRYIHQVGPNGGFGRNGGFGGNGGNGGEGGGGGFGLNGPNDPDGSDGPDRPHKIEYIGRKIYAERYPYIHKVIKALIDEYISSDILDTDGSSNHYSKVYSNKEVAVKCHYLSAPNQTEFVTQYPPSHRIEKGEKPGSYYSFKGTRTLNTVANALTSKIKLEYEVFVRVVEEVTE